MYPQLAMTAVILGSMFSMSSFANEVDVEEEKKRRNARVAIQSFEPVVDIHNTPVVMAHPTLAASKTASLAELSKLRVAGEQRERGLRAWYAARGQAYPERFAGD